MAKILTAAAVAKIRPDKVRREIPDGGCQGLYLVIQTSGVKSWAYRFRQPKGKPAKITLGRADVVGTEVAEPQIGALLSLAAARKIATGLSHRRAAGEDIMKTRRNEKEKKAEQGEKTFKAEVFNFIEEYAKPKNRRCWPEQVRLLGVHQNDDGKLDLVPKGLASRWEDQLLAEITSADIRSVVDEARRKGVPGVERRVDGLSESRARAMRAALSVVFSRAHKDGRIASNPVAATANPDKPEDRDRVLSETEIKKFWKASEAEAEQVTAVLRLLLLSGQRMDEVREMRRGELSDDLAMWSIPSDRTKNKKPHLVPLPPLAREILKEFVSDRSKMTDIERKADDAKFVFSMDGRSAPAIGSKIKMRLDKVLQAEDWRFHDLRRSAITQMNELGIRPDIVELCVNHISGHKTGVGGTYNHAKKLPERKIAFERWADHVANLVADRKQHNVVSIDQARA